MQIGSSLDTSLHILEIVVVSGTIIGATAKVVSKLNKFLVWMDEYPPHRHVGPEMEDIIYPKGYAPDGEQGHRAIGHGAD